MSTTPSSSQNATVGIPVNFPQLPACRQISPAASLCGDCAKVDGLNLEISEAESRLLEMKRARQKALSDANRRHDVLMKSFPLEICSEIFRHYLPPIDHISQGDSSPLILSAVSRSWRALCHSMPDLWAVMRLRVATRNDYRANILAEVAQDWITRSKFLPISLIIDISICADPQGDYFPALIAAVNRQSQRLAYLWMKAPGSLFDLVDFEEHGAPKLLKLNVQTLGTVKRGPRFASGALVHLSLSVHGWNPLSTRFGIVTDNLSEAHLTVINWPDLLAIFRNSRRLRICSINNSLRGRIPWDPGFNLPNQLKPPTIVHHALESLHLTNQRSKLIFSILMELLALPSLKEFRFLSEGTTSEVTILDFSNQLQRHITQSSSKLEVLALCNFHFDNFDEPPLYTPISSLIRTVGPTIRQIILEPSGRTTFQDPNRLIKSVVECGVTLESLESLQVYGPPNWWIHTLRELTMAGEAFYERTGKRIRLILNARKCSGWWANTLNELIGLPRTYQEDYDKDAVFAVMHDDLPPLSNEDTKKLVLSMIDTSRFDVQVLNTENGVFDGCLPAGY